MKKEVIADIFLMTSSRTSNNLPFGKGLHLGVGNMMDESLIQKSSLDSFKALAYSLKELKIGVYNG